MKSKKVKFCALEKKVTRSKKYHKKINITKSIVNDLLKNLLYPPYFLCPRTNERKKSLDNKDLKILDDNVRKNLNLSVPKTQRNPQRKNQ